MAQPGMIILPLQLALKATTIIVMIAEMKGSIHGHNSAAVRSNVGGSS
jgi:hypothetical protein